MSDAEDVLRKLAELTSVVSSSGQPTSTACSAASTSAWRSSRPSRQSNLGFCDVIFGWDIADVLYDNVKYTGWHTGYPDATACIDLSTLRFIPWEPGTAFFLMDMRTREGDPLPISPRQVLCRVLDRAARSATRRGSQPNTSSGMFRETPQTLREKRFPDLATLSPGMFGYSVLRASQNAPLVLDMLDAMEGFGIPLEGFHTETGPGVYRGCHNSGRRHCAPRTKRYCSRRR